MKRDQLIIDFTRIFQEIQQVEEARTRGLDIVTYPDIWTSDIIAVKSVPWSEAGLAKKLKDDLPQIKNSITFKSLIKEFDLLEYHEDLISIAVKCQKMKILWDSINDFTLMNSEEKPELIKTLSFLYSFELDQIRVVFKSTLENQSTSMKNIILLDIIRRSLLEYYIKHDLYYQALFTNTDEIQNWDSFLSKLENYVPPQKAKRGRRRKHYSTGIMIDIIQTYLQKKTHLKAPTNIPISNQQAQFIYKFLVELNILPDNLIWSEDNIRHILYEYRNDRTGD